MDARNLESHAERGEFYLCLARAFLTPQRPAAHEALQAALADDLESLGEALGYPFAAELAQYRAEMGRIADHATLLRLYSGLFLAPPRAVHLNTAAYLDGTVNGGTVLAMEAHYRRCGVDRSTDFRDLSDHLSVQLEFVAWLYFRSAEAMAAGTPAPEVRPERFLHDYVARWLPPFVRDLEEYGRQHAGLPNPYLALARILAAAVAQDAIAGALPARELRAQRALHKARRDRAERGVTDEDMEFIARRLREKGLATEHLAIAPELRDEARGYKRKEPPAPRRGSRYG